MFELKSKVEIAFLKDYFLSIEFALVYMNEKR